MKLHLLSFKWRSHVNVYGLHIQASSSVAVQSILAILPVPEPNCQQMKADAPILLLSSSIKNVRSPHSEGYTEENDSAEKSKSDKSKQGSGSTKTRTNRSEEFEEQWHRAL